MYRKIIEKSPAIPAAPILIIDDSDIGLSVITKFLSDEGFSNLHPLKSALEAREFLKKNEPSLIITDIHMPGIDGHAFVKELRSTPLFETTPVIFQTGSTKKEDITKAYVLGANDVLTKPIDKYELLSKVTLHLESKLYRKRIEEELHSAAELQKALIPDSEKIKDVSEKYKLDIAYHLAPCSEVGGDFWGVKKISHSELGIYTVDISGHGFAAALNTFRVHSVLNDPNNFFSSSGLFLKKLNKKITGLMPTGQFATVFYAVMNFQDNYLQFSSASSPCGIIIRSNGNVDNLSVNSLPAGVIVDAEYEAFEKKFLPNDILILYSDALIESPNQNGDFFTQQQIGKLVAENKDKKSAEILDAVLHEFRKHTEGTSVNDDLTITIYKRL